VNKLKYPLTLPSPLLGEGNRAVFPSPLWGED